MAKVEFGELAKKLGVAKNVIRRLVYLPESTLRYTEEIMGDKRIQYFEEEEVLKMLRQSLENQGKTI